MKLTPTLAALIAVLAVKATSLHEKRDFTYTGCVPAVRAMGAYDRPFVAPLYEACIASIGKTVAARENPWISKTCVASAVASTVSHLTASGPFAALTEHMYSCRYWPTGLHATRTKAR